MSRDSAAPSAARLRERTVSLTNGSNPLATIRLLWQGPHDPQMRVGGREVVRAMRLPTGAATVHLTVSRTQVAVSAWGEGADEALDSLPGLIGEHDDPAALVPRHRVVGDLCRRMAGLRMTRSGLVMETLVPTIIAQKVTGLEAHRGHRALLTHFGEHAPGPFGLRLLPPPEKLARLPYWAFHEIGIERRRADTIRAAAAVAASLERLVGLPGDEARRRLQSLPGIGPWTAAETTRLAMGDPDAVSIGDYHVPHLVGWALAGEHDADDQRMLELLEPYRGQRARVVLLLEQSGFWPERRGPRMAPRSIATI